MWNEFKRQVGGIGREAKRQLLPKTINGKRPVTSGDFQRHTEEDYKEMDETMTAYADFLKSAEED